MELCFTEWIILAAGSIVVPEKCLYHSWDPSNEAMIKFICDMVYTYAYFWNKLCSLLM